MDYRGIKVSQPVIVYMESRVSEVSGEMDYMKQFTDDDFKYSGMPRHVIFLFYSTRTLRYF